MRLSYKNTKQWILSMIFLSSMYDNVLEMIICIIGISRTSHSVPWRRELTWYITEGWLAKK